MAPNRIIDAMTLSESEMNEAIAFFQLLVLHGGNDKKPINQRRMTMKDLKGLFRRIGYQVSNEELKEIIRNIHDSFSCLGLGKMDGPIDSINFKQFLHLIHDKPDHDISRNQLLESFRILSEAQDNQKGFINVQDLERYLFHFDPPSKPETSDQWDEEDSNSDFPYSKSILSRQEFSKLLNILDPYSSGKINYEKFVDMIFY